MSDRPIVLVSNVSCHVEARGPVIACQASRTPFDIALVALAWSGLAGGAVLAWSDPRPEIAALVLASLGAFAWAWRRCRSLGTFRFDPTARLVVHEPGGGGARRFFFDDVVEMRESTDGFDVSRLDLLPWHPSFLVLTMKDGTVLRVAKGDHSEVCAVRDALSRLGVSARAAAGRAR